MQPVWCVLLRIVTSVRLTAACIFQEFGGTSPVSDSLVTIASEIGICQIMVLLTVRYIYFVSPFHPWT